MESRVSTRRADAASYALGWPDEGAGTAPRGGVHVVVGSRGFSRPSLVAEYVRGLPKGSLVVSGGARGVDRLAVWVAEKEGLDWVEIEADWDDVGVPGAVVRRRADGSEYNVLAGMWRNAELVELAATAEVGRVVAFWDGKSRGTRHTIGCAYNLRVHTEIIFDKDLG